ncbi:MAG: PD40 domain-containing protein [Acidobacteria bacterium]|nr:PD40 domain-containing protein [Acidobacteriota bacterium]
MFRIKYLYIVVLSLCPLLIFGGPKFLTEPTLSPDGSEVVFSYAGDLWIASSNGGTAYRLTGMQGIESNPRISPDGKWLAFSGRQNGNADVYILNLEGGSIKQLTFHENNDIVESWDWNSKDIFFTSSRYNNFTSFSVSREGGTPTRIFENFFNTIDNLVLHPTDGRIFFTDTWETGMFPARKGYRGSFNADIKSYNPKTGEYRELTTFEGKDFQPTIDKNGNLYFLSDEVKDTFNLYKLEKGDRARLTDFQKSIFNINVSANGNKIVFEKEYELFIYDIATAKTSPLIIETFQDNFIAKEKDFNVSGKIENFDVSPDGKKFAFISRGELFVSDIKGKFIKKLNTSASGRVLEVLWLNDNLTLLFNQTVGGWQNLFTIKADGSAPEKQITSDIQNNRNISLSSDRKKAAYLSGKRELRILDLETLKSTTIYETELWGLYNPIPLWSPDDRYIAFTKIMNFERDILLYDLKEKKVVNLTNSGVGETSPYWSPDGKYLYLEADRYNPEYPRGTTYSHIYRVPLQKFDSDFRETEYNKLFEPEQKSDDKDKKDKETKPETKIDINQFKENWERVSPTTGQQFGPHVIQDGGKTYVFFVSNHDSEAYNLWKVTYESFEKPKTEKIKGAVADSTLICSAKGAYYTIANGTINTLDIAGNSLTPINMNFTFKRNHKEEFNQMYWETWANIGENYYDEKYHGIDWETRGQKYAEFLPYIQTRADLRRLFEDLLGELNSSHLGFYSNGDEEETYLKVNTMEPGIVWDKKSPFTVDYILPDSPIDKVGIDINKGDLLVAVNGTVIPERANRNQYFTNPDTPEELVLTFKRGEKKFDINIHPEKYTDYRARLYREWIDTNQERVDKKSGKRIAYIHMQNMGTGELYNFFREMNTEWYNRDALILDIRYNRGGNVHDAVLNYLGQKTYTRWKYRGGEYAPQPNFAPSDKPIVLLINQQSLSDAEMTAAGFKELKLGKIIGTETYRWLIFTSGKRLVDGSFYRLPSWGCYYLDGRDIEKTGVTPDIEIDNTFLDRIKGDDPQLDRAIEEIMKELK